MTIKRYGQLCSLEGGDMYEATEGDYVRHSDHQTEVARLRVAMEHALKWIGTSYSQYSVFALRGGLEDKPYEILTQGGGT